MTLSAFFLNLEICNCNMINLPAVLEIEQSGVFVYSFNHVLI